jgi:hypothetical protein
MLAFGMLLTSLAMGAQQLPASLHAYTTCKFDDGLAIVEKAPLPAGALGRTVDTSTGMRRVAILRGERLAFSYPNTDPFARATVEQLPASSGAKGKEDLIAAFDRLLATDSTVQRNYALKAHINGFEAYGMDRTELEGRVLGIYLLIDDKSLTVTSIDFLNQPGQQKFTTLEEYAKLRDHFLESYTACVRQAPASLAKPAAKAPVKKAPAKKTSAKKK